MVASYQHCETASREEGVAYLKIEDGGFTYIGTAEADTVFGWSGADSIDGLSGRDILLGGDGIDYVAGGFGNDTIDGQNDNDWHVNGGRDDDAVFGGNGDDRVYGGQGNDLVFGDGENDTISGDLGADTLVGATGDDMFVFEAGSGTDEIVDFGKGDDVIVIEENVNGSGIFTAADAMARVTDDGMGNSVLDLGDGNIVLLSGVPPGSLTIEDFLII